MGSQQLKLDSIKGNYFNYLKLLNATEASILIMLAIITLGSAFLVIANPIHAAPAQLKDATALATFTLIPLAALCMIGSRIINIKTGYTKHFLLPTIVVSILIYYAGACGIWSIALTPHTRIDAAIEKFDLAMGFNITATMAWPRPHHALMLALAHAYDSWETQLILAPIIVTALGNYKRCLQYFLCMTFAMAIGGLIYYFWPTTAPATVIHSKYFLSSQYNLIKNFNLLRSGSSDYYPSSGLVSFPSFHVIGATAVILLVWRNKILRWPVLVLNILLIYSTLALGFHYLADVIAGILIAGICFYLAGKIGRLDRPA